MAKKPDQSLFEPAAEGPVFDGNSHRPKNIGQVSPELFSDGAGIRPKRLMCTKVGTPGYECQTEFEMANDEDIVERGLTPGHYTYLHKCVTAGSAEGEFVPVKDVKDALETAKDHCACVTPKALEATAAARRKCARNRTTE